MAEINLNPYVFFTGNCREAMEFYHKALGGELKVQTFKEAGMDNPESADRVMHASLVAEGINLMGADSDRKEAYPVSRVSLSLVGDNQEQLTKVFNDLAEGGEVTSELKKEMWGDIFGTLTDKFGVDWMINISAQLQNS